MELTKTKFKQTEVGLIPEDWKVASLNQVTKDMLQGVNTAIDIPEYVRYGKPMLKANDVIDGDIDFNDVDYISEKTYNRYSNRFKAKRGDFLFSNIGARLGTGALLKKDVQCSFAWNVMRIIPNQEKIHPEFLSCSINSPNFYKSIISNQTGSGMGFVPKNILKNIQIPLPPKLEEQKAIAQVLSDTDNLIQAIEQKLTKKRAIKQGAMQVLLTPKADWEIKTLGAIAHFYNGKAHEQFIDANGDYKVINSKFVSTGGKVYKSATVNLCPLKKGDITMVMSDIPNGKALAKCFLVPTDDKYALNQRICAIRTEEVDTEFLYFILNRNKYYLAFDSGTGQTNLKKNDVLDCPIPLPRTKQEQTEIATILLDMNKEIEQLEQKLSKYKMVKQGLMQNLLTGKIRLV